MWISKLLSDNTLSDKAQTANVTAAQGGCVSAASSCEIRDIPVYSPYGIDSVPVSQSDVLIVPCCDGYAMCGSKSSSEGLEEGEIRLYSSGGASITLKNNGDIILNKLLIKPDGSMIKEA